jgi:hypothetical protein
MSEKLHPGESLRVGDSITSLNGRFRLILQGDGNLVLYQDMRWPLWYSNTAGQAVDAAVMQGDGNFVLYGPGGKVLRGGSNASKVPSGTDGNPGAWIQIQDDGNLVIYQNRPGPVPLWNTSTFAVSLDGKVPSFPIVREETGARGRARVTVGTDGVAVLEMWADCPANSSTTRYVATTLLTGYKDTDENNVLTDRVESHSITVGSNPFHSSHKHDSWIIGSVRPEDLRNVRKVRVLLERDQSEDSALDQFIKLTREVGQAWDAADSLYKKVKHSELGQDILLVSAV